MKTIQITGTKEQIDKFRSSLSFSINEMPRQVETRVYIVDVHNYEFDTDATEWDNDKFMSESEIQGNIFTIEGFQKGFNESNVNSLGSYVRFINV